MKKKWKQSCPLYFLILGTLIFTGCTKDKKADTNTLYVQRGGSVIEAVVEELDKEYYDSKELKEWVQSEVDSYNKKNGKNKLKIRKNESDHKKAKVNIAYDTMEDYAKFNKLTAFQGTIADAQKAGYEFKGEFKSTSDKPSITEAELDQSNDYKLLILSENQKLNMYKKILYVSKNVKINNKDHKIAEVTADKENPAYIIYK